MSEILDQLAKGKQEQMPQGEPEQRHEMSQDDADDGEAKIKIGDKEFRTQEEAFAYAQSLDQKSTLIEARSDAYRQAIQDAAFAQQNAQKVTPAAEPEEDFDAKFYENPKEFLKQYGEKISAATEAKILGQISTRTEDDKLWSDFFGANPDLAGFREDCESVLTKHTEDIKAINQTKGQKAAMDYLAQKTRAKFQSYNDNAKPRRELPATSNGASMGSPGNVTRNIKQAEPVDFITEIRQARNKRG